MPTMQRKWFLLKISLVSLTLAIFCIVSVQAQQWQPLRRNLRPAVSFPSSPAAAISPAPATRNQPTRSMAASRNTDWLDMGNGARIRIPDKLESDKRIDPDVLAAIEELKEQAQKPLYQLRQPPNQPAPVTRATQNSLIAPQASEQDSSARDIGADTSKVSFPPERNIRITSLDFRQTNVTDALRSLAQLININLMLSPGIQGQVTILFSDVTLEEAFNTILTSYDLSFVWEGTILRVFPKSSAPLQTRIFAIQHTNAAQIKPIIDRMLTPNRGESEIDARTNSLLITDTVDKLAEIRSILPQIDVSETLVDISSRPITEVFYLDYTDATPLRAPIEMLAPTVQIQEFSSSQASQAGAAGGTTGGRMDMMIITDTQSNLSRIRELIEKLDMPPIQVTIDAHIYEIDKNEEERLGINWQKSIPIPGTEESLLDIKISPETSDAGGTGVFRFGSLDVNQFRALLAMLKTHSFARVLSNPVITTLNNREANITVGQAIPYISASQVNAETGQITNTVGQANADISLVVTPSVTGNDEVFLDIQPTISSVLGFTELGGNATPNISSRSAQTQVIVKNNHTIVIGGMIKTDKSESMSKVPFFGDLPGIGKLFQRKSFRETRTELIIFITPHIVQREANRHKTMPSTRQPFVTPRLSLQP